MKISLLCLQLYILLSWITHSVGQILFGINANGGGASNPLVRMTVGDLFGFLGIFIYLIVSLKRKIYLPQSIRAVFILLLLLIPGIFTAARPFNVFMEVFILFFMIVVAILFIDQYRVEKLFISFLKLLTVTSLLAALVGFWDLAAGFSPLPHIFQPRLFELNGKALESGLISEPKSGFRNAGQAGTYFMMMVTILAPLKFSMIYNYLSKGWKRILNIALPLSILFLVVTFKMAAVLGLVVALPLYALFFRNIKLGLAISVFMIIAIAAMPTIEYLAPQFYSRAHRKVTTRVLKYFMSEYNDENAVASNNFIATNYGLAMKSFTDKPLTGSGLGGFAGVYMKYEVHSTPMKLIGETGILGIVGYFVFMTLFLFHFIKAIGYHRKNPYRDFLLKMTPFIIGCFINWTYTFHLRKRPFWFIFTAVVIGFYMMQKWERNNVVKLKNTDKINTIG